MEEELKRCYVLHYVSSSGYPRFKSFPFYRFDSRKKERVPVEPGVVYCKARIWFDEHCSGTGTLLLQVWSKDSIVVKFVDLFGDVYDENDDDYLECIERLNLSEKEKLEELKNKKSPV